MEFLKWKDVFIGDGYKKLLSQNIVNPQGDEDYRIFSRTVAGLGWPSDKPGGFVVAGETLASHPFPSDVIILDVFESPDPQELLNHYCEARINLKFTEAFADLTNGPMKQFQYRYNDSQRANKRKQTSLRQPRFWEEDGRIAHHLQSCKTMLQTGDKHLFLEGHQRLAAALSDIAYTEMHQLKEADVPLLAALGYVVGYLHAEPYQVEQQKPKKWDVWDALDGKNDTWDVWKVLDEL